MRSWIRIPIRVDEASPLSKGAGATNTEYSEGQSFECILKGILREFEDDFVISNSFVKCLP